MNGQCPDLISDAVALVNALGLSSAAAAPIIGDDIAQRIERCAFCDCALVPAPRRFGCCSLGCIHRLRGNRKIKKFQRAGQA